MKTVISIIAKDSSGNRAVITAETEQDWIAFDASHDASGFRIHDLREVQLIDERGAFRWQNEGEFSGVKP